MATNSPSTLPFNPPIAREQFKTSGQGDRMLSKRRLLKWFGLASTLVLSAGALAPNMFGIPLAWRPWVFLASIFWIFALVTGMFSL
jgi:hypothetical protein